jgi:hypothetical protein
VKTRKESLEELKVPSPARISRKSAQAFVRQNYAPHGD